jgi:hypothetical protein
VYLDTFLEQIVINFDAPLYLETQNASISTPAALQLRNQAIQYDLNASSAVINQNNNQSLLISYGNDADLMYFVKSLFLDWSPITLVVSRRALQRFVPAANVSGQFPVTLYCTYFRVRLFRFIAVALMIE